MKKMVIGIMPQNEIRARAIAIARGTYKSKRGYPRIRFPSMRLLVQGLSDQNRTLLRVISATRPTSISVLAKPTGYSRSKLSRILKMLEHYGLVKLKRSRTSVRPFAPTTTFKIITSVN